MAPAQPKCLIFDVESIPATNGRPAVLAKIGALRPDTGAELELTVQGSPERALRALDELAKGASFVLGHNILEHDLPLLRDLVPDLQLLSLPAVDTLRLSPLAFPQNPYHRLIKDYKLIRASLNSPLSDCRSTLTLFQDQQQAFAQLKNTHPQELATYQALLAPKPGPGLGNVLLAIMGAPPSSLDKLRQTLPLLLAENDPGLTRDLKVCRTRLTQLLETNLMRPENHWPVAYALAWLRVSGGNSVLAPWVRHQFPAVCQLLTELRDLSCDAADCQYCRTTHDPRHELRRYFGHPDFRRDSQGRDLQHQIVSAGMRGESVLAVLATGGGKSLCYQLPALNRYHRNGSLTVVISPLQALMKDQVDGLLARNVQCAAALNGLLTMPERADVLEKIQLGDVGILLVSPEQFRNRGFRKAILQRQVGAWIFDEAHCLSKWGNDFRPDYLYAARFIREFSAGEPCAPIGCFTATAKREVVGDIRAHFHSELQVEFHDFLGTHERKNLIFDVLPTSAAEKRNRVHRLLEEELCEYSGGAVVFVASRKKAEEMADFLLNQEWPCRYFHAGLPPHQKKDIQEAFMAGELQVIVATNAFGMGVDKSDVRLVIHADIPGSLENYLQEAGRAGRDQANARCVLLYDPNDIETQFGLNERSRLSQRDIDQILRKLRSEHTRRKGAQLVISAGEVLLDEGVDTSFAADDQDAETKVVTAVAWLERGQYLTREENQTRIFPARLGASLEQAQTRLEQANLSVRQREEFLAILTYLQQAKADERIHTDELLALTGQTTQELNGTLKQLEKLGLLVNDTQLTLYLRHKIENPASERLEQSLQLEKALLSELREQAPDADQGGWLDVNLVPLTETLRHRLDRTNLLPLHILRLLRSLAQDRDGDSQQRSCIELRQLNRDYLKLRIRGGHTWNQVQAQGDKRRALASALMPFLLSKIPPGARGKDVLLQTTFGELLQVIAEDLELNATLKLEQRQQALEQVLLYLHQQEVATLNHGMTVMRRAMTIEINPAKTGRYLKEDFQKLDEHYREKRIQVHVMREYAEVALREMAAALQLVADYLAMGKQQFLRSYFKGKEAVLKLATSEASWRSIIDPLNAQQKLLVSSSDERNTLILAGPGSGKTRVIVHRIAWLLRVNRVPAGSIIALTFNRHAANEIRQRLLKLVGNDAYGLTVLTYHAMAMRLTGTSFAGRENVGKRELEAVLEKAVELLEGKTSVEGENGLRERLLRGYRYILVDEYQDIDDPQYRLVSALAKRRDADDADLTILAVGDDDQNIYAWRGGSNTHIENFCREYDAELDYLVENYRSSGAIIHAANALIEQNPGRLKAQQPIVVDQDRRREPGGGRWQTLDAQRQGRVLCLELPARDQKHGNIQAQAAIAELQRLLILEAAGDPLTSAAPPQQLPWQGCAILARSHRYLFPLQTWCEQKSVPYSLAADKDNQPPAHRQRDFIRVIDHLRTHPNPRSADEIQIELQTLPISTDWQSYFAAALNQLQGEYGDCPLASTTIVDWLYDYSREMRQQPRPGLYLGTVHSAKGLEFRHVVVLDGDWHSRSQSTRPEHIEEERRLYYVAMTRAQQTLTLCQFAPGNPFANSIADHIQQQTFNGSHDPALDKRHLTLSLSDINLGYPGKFPPDAEIHRAIAATQPGDFLSLIPDDQVYNIQNAQGQIIGKTSQAFKLPLKLEACEVAMIVTRFSSDGKEGFRQGLLCDRWEVVVPRVRGVWNSASSSKA